MAKARQLPDSVRPIGKTKTKSGRFDYTFSVSCIKCGKERVVRRRQHAIAMSKKLCKRCSNINNHPQNSIGGIRVSHFNKYKTGADQRGKSWSITVEQAAKVLKNQAFKCALSGVDVVAEGPFDEITASLDRIDNSGGYEPNNIQWVHKDINMMRGALDVKKFVELCEQVANKENNMANRDKEMIDGVATLIRKVKSKANRKEIAQYALRDFKKEKVAVDPDKFMKRVGL
jgi:hypothetical protein